MHIRGFLHKTLSSVIPQKRLNTLNLLIQTILETKRLSVTELGRGMDLPIKESSAIRRADRFIGNKKLYQEKFEIQKSFPRHVNLLLSQTEGSIIAGLSKCLPVVGIIWGEFE